MPYLVRSASLTGYAEAARAGGLDPFRMLAEVGLPADSLSDVDLKIPADRVGRLLELSAQRSGIETFGLRMAETRRASNLGPLILLVRDEPTLRQALQAMARYGHLHNEAIFLHVEEEDGIAVIRDEVLAGGAGSLRQATELVVGVLFRLLRFFLGDDWHPKTIFFAHGAPKDRTVHTRVFGTNVEFGHAFSGIVCNASDLDLPLPSADPVMARYVRRYLDDLDPDGGKRMLDEVRQMVLMLLPSGRSTIDHIARHLGINRRTIHRHLAQDGTTFSSVLDAVRSELAVRYLNRGERQCAEISGLLGFSEPSAFTRWFGATFGCSPTQFQVSAENTLRRKKQTKAHRTPGKKDTQRTTLSQKTPRRP
ncbi:AraC family transcriptional regulator [Ralstonia soli]|uniref:AraC family transcriptional regulator n=1 Tax=Ralstonia soli TaxID=2953896 RepID=A0ABT1AT28_9RALS|nr:AraC family transcriptional regulator [Ralstonia soli]MCO5401601.1 AraC family transcriptional regulator [Ralstonia soli]